MHPDRRRKGPFGAREPQPAGLLALALALVPDVCRAEVSDKMMLFSLTEAWVFGLLATAALFCAWRIRLWLGAISFLPLFLAAGWNSWSLHSEPFAADLQRELGPVHTASADLLVLFALVATVTGALLRVGASVDAQRRPPGRTRSRRARPAA